MRNTNKWLVLLLTVVMLVNVLGVSAMAAGNEAPIELHISSAAGGAVQADILATQTQAVADGRLVVTYDPAVLTYVGTESGDAWPVQITLSVNAAEGKIILAFASAETAQEGALFTLAFTGTGDAVIAVDGDDSYITGFGAVSDMTVSTCPSAQFADIQGSVPTIHEAVDFMVSNGYMKGVSNTMFAPEAQLNRAMMVTILYRIAGEPEVSGSHTFVDVPDDVFYTEPVIWALNSGITKGLDSTHFGPEKALSRQELVTFLYRFAGVMGYDRTASADLSGYTDYNEVPSFALVPFQWAVGAGVVNGTSDTTLSPADFTNRAQICIMVSRMLSELD